MDREDKIKYICDHHKKSYVQRNINKSCDVFLWNGHLIDVFERTESRVPCAYDDVKAFYDYMEEFNGLGQYKLIEIMYNLDKGNIGFMKAEFIYFYPNPEKQTLKEINELLPTDVEWNGFFWNIEWELKTLDEIVKNIVK